MTTYIILYYKYLSIEYIYIVGIIFNVDCVNLETPLLFV